MHGEHFCVLFAKAQDTYIILKSLQYVSLMYVYSRLLNLLPVCKNDKNV